MIKRRLGLRGRWRRWHKRGTLGQKWNQHGDRFVISKEAELNNLWSIDSSEINSK